MAQIGNYLGPGILSQSAAGIGQASGQQVDLRFWVDISGVYDTSIQPYAVNAQGGLVKVGALYGGVGRPGRLRVAPVEASQAWLKLFRRFLSLPEQFRLRRVQS